MGEDKDGSGGGVRGVRAGLSRDFGFDFDFDLSKEAEAWKKRESRVGRMAWHGWERGRRESRCDVRVGTFRLSI